MNSSGSPMESPLGSMNSPMGPGSGPNGPMPGGPSGPDPTQPLPPSGLSGNGFNKNSPIMGGPNPAPSDPNYAQQFHNFQQQLYATNTRSQGGGMGPGGHSPGMGSLPHRSNTPPGFNQNWQPSGPLSK